MANDSDLYNRWQAAQDYATRVMIAGVAGLRDGKRPAKPSAFVAALGVTFCDPQLEPGYRAQFMLLPSENDIARIIGRDVDPLAIHKARDQLRKAIGTRHAAALADIYREYELKGPYSPQPEAAGKRALRNAALGYLAARGTAEDIARLAAHFAGARNATDEVSALAMLAEVRSPERDKAFERFYERWKGDHLVIDNWFAYQAASSLPTTLATVKRLTRHPLFSIKNPNKVRALIGTFAVGQPRHLQSGRRQGLRVHRRPRARDRRLQPAGGGTTALSLPQLEGARTRAAPACQEGAAAHLQGEAPVARRLRDRRAHARVRRRRESWRSHGANFVRWRLSTLDKDVRITAM